MLNVSLAAVKSETVSTSGKPAALFTASSESNPCSFGTRAEKLMPAGLEFVSGNGVQDNGVQTPILGMQKYFPDVANPPKHARFRHPGCAVAKRHARRL